MLSFFQSFMAFALRKTLPFTKHSWGGKIQRSNVCFLYELWIFLIC